MTIDIVEELHSADPEEAPSAANIIMTRAAAEIETLRTRLGDVEALMADQHDQIERLRGILLALLDYFGDDSSYRHPGSDRLVALARAALKGP
jgi:hypothetical protein